MCVLLHRIFWIFVEVWLRAVGLVLVIESAQQFCSIFRLHETRSQLLLGWLLSLYLAVGLGYCVGVHGRNYSTWLRVCMVRVDTRAT